MNKHDNLIDYAAHEGAVIVAEIIRNHPVLDEHDVRQQVILFSVFANCIQRLHLQGWPEQRLIMEVFEHCELARFIKEMNDDDTDKDE
jgi:hypothetical protein